MPYGIPPIKSILPWSVGELKNAEPPYQAARSKDSSRIEAYSIPSLMVEIVGNLKDKELLRKLIVTDIDNANSCIEFSSENWRNVSSETKSLVCEIWKEEFSDVVISNDEYRERRYMRKPGEKKQFKHIDQRGLYRFLRACGIRDLYEEMIESRVSTVNMVAPMRLSFANSETALFDLLDFLIKKSSAEIEIRNESVEICGQRYFVLSVPGNFKSESIFTIHGDGYAGECLRAAAIVGHCQSCPIQLITLEDDEVLEFDIHTIGSRGPNVFSNSIDIVSYDAEQRANYSSLTNGTYILIPENAGSQKIEMSGLMGRAKQLLADFKQKIAEARAKARIYQLRANTFQTAQRVRELTGLRRGRVSRTGLMEWSDGASRSSSAGLGSLFSGMSASGLGQIAPDTPTSGRNMDFLNDTTAIAGHGFYTNSVTTRFVHNPVSDTLYTEGCTDLMPFNVRRKRYREDVPDVFCRHKITNLDGERSLPVLNGHKIVSYELIASDNDVQFFRDVRTGIFTVVGVADELIYYTAPDELSEYIYYKSQAPLDEESEDVVEMQCLDDRWREFLGKFPINRRSKLTKSETERRLGLALVRWAQDYTYDDYFDLNDQVEGYSVGQITAQILNQRRGICNLSAAGFAVLLRAIGIPSRILGGFSIDGRGAGSHATVEYWNTEKWVECDPGRVISSSGNIVDGGFAGKVCRIKDAVACNEETLSRMYTPAMMKRSVRIAMIAILVGAFAMFGVGLRSRVKSTLNGDNQDNAPLVVPDSNDAEGGTDGFGISGSSGGSNSDIGLRGDDEKSCKCD